MWLGVAAGLALSFARSVNAQNAFVNDQQLTYVGQGWGIFQAPPACAGLSQTVHSTTHPGDTVSYSFTGNGVFVHSPVSASGPMPVTVVLDGTVQTVSTVTQPQSGCGILFSNLNIANGRQQHTLVIVLAESSKPTTLSISGISTTNGNTSFAASSTVPPGAVPTDPSTVPLTPNSTVANAVGGASPTDGSAPTGGSSTSGDGSSSTAGVIKTSSVSTPRMTAGVIGAIVGSIIGMIGLLVIFMLIRRRISRQSARKLDVQSNFIRGMEEGKGKGKATFMDAGRAPVWSMAEKADVGSWHFAFANNQGRPSLDQGRSQTGTPYYTTVPNVPPGAARGTPSRSPEMASTRSPVSPSTISPSTGAGLVPATYDRSQPPTDVRTVPAAFFARQQDAPSPPPPGLEDVGSSGQRAGLPPVRSSDTTWGTGADEMIQRAYVASRVEATTWGSSTGEKFQRPYVVNRSESASVMSERSGGSGGNSRPPQPGFF